MIDKPRPSGVEEVELGSFQKGYSDTGNRTPSYRVKGDNVSRYTISDGVDFVIKR